MRYIRNIFEHFLSWLYTRQMYGPRCSDFAEHCPCCEAWQQHDDIFNGGLAKKEGGE
jgi:hypothetical protein